MNELEFNNLHDRTIQSEEIISFYANGSMGHYQVNMTSNNDSGQA